MLVLKRKIGESLMIGDDVEITLLEKDGDTVKIGINAPRHIRVYRKEIFEEITEQNRSALQQQALPEELRLFFSKQNEK